MSSRRTFDGLGIGKRRMSSRRALVGLGREVSSMKPPEAEDAAEEAAEEAAEDAAEEAPGLLEAGQPNE
jgi:hypothetical protein